MQISDKSLYRFLLFLAIAVNFSGLFLIIIGPDGSLYAAISKKIAMSGNWLELFGNGTDWLDKPHFPFWITAVSFKIFGISYWSYKLPAILFLLGGAWYTYAFAKKLYNTTVALWSVLILLTAQHIILSNTDVRAEPYLTALIMAAVFHFYRVIETKIFVQLILASFFAACAVMTKGMFALIPIAAAIGGHLVIKGDWKNVFHWRWLVAIVLILIMIIPELYSLYYQFDLHPEKTVFGQQNVSGLKFFFWDSQFGRFFNTGPIKGKGDPTFFLHTTLWAFLPWSILFYVAIFRKIKDGIQKKENGEWYTVCGSLATFLLFSASSFQLPHYMNIVFPFFAIITADYLFRLHHIKSLRIFNRIQTGLVILMIILVTGLYLIYKPGHSSWIALLVIVILFFAAFYISAGWKERWKEKMITKSICGVVAVNLFLNWIFYPDLLQYQGGTKAAEYLNQQYPGVKVVQLFPRFSYTLEFDLDAPLITIPSLDDTSGLQKPYILFIQKGDDSTILSKPVHEVKQFHVSKLNGKFIYQKTREGQLSSFRLYYVN
ncbi:ArnT family glycosyltransferase [Pollutibacter soli]|uniref:ArnT family glycosyltransferase n=1 Tax=Pollutibacter soli TaxID=3034157 RepID=UPI0030137242